ncbi:hypothetical protein DAPPUDRAFT_120687 [Daphnia pulex]|uniref:Uncharacterized protein n=1 Tax=Daphnia pulex TaxID=6669 RepID=E9I1Z9_DAPPU|nr:hypothetical protein DAPPUDRAFT_120687 [Daphnia pulex]|eukprot:EFX61981.1 hypothetical protein DAPPUDRAFT_120687 [Daphnia pulex]
MGSGHLVPKNSRTHFFNHLVPVRDGGTRWHLAVENSTGWYEVAGIIFRLVRGGWHNLPAGTSWLEEVSGWAGNIPIHQLHVIRPQSLYIPDQEIKTEKMLVRSRKGIIALDCTTCSLLDCLFSLVNSLAASSLKIWSRCQFSFGTILSCQKPFYSDLLEEIRRPICTKCGNPFLEIERSIALNTPSPCRN